MPAVDRDLGAAAAGDDRGRAPGRHILARRAPEFPAVGEIEDGEEGVLLHIAEDDDFSLVDDRRAGEAPLRGRHLEIAGDHRAEVFFPEQFAGGIEAEEPLGTEDRDDALAVGRGRGVAVRGLGVARDLRHALVDAHARHRLRQWLCRKHKVRGAGTGQYPDEYLYETLGLVRLTKTTANLPWAKA